MGPFREMNLIKTSLGEMAYLAPTKTFSWPSPDMAMVFARFGCNNPPPPVPPFLLMDIAT